MKPRLTVTFTEAQLREAMKHHRPGNEGYCLCAWRITAPNPQQEFTVGHLIDVLKEGDRS